MGPSLSLDQFQSILPDAPYVSNDLQRGLIVRGRTTAALFKSVQVNLPWKKSVLTFDVDHEQAGAAWLEYGLPPTWAAINPKNHHAHFGYVLTVPVLTHQDSREHPQRYLRAVYEAMRGIFEADPRYSGLITKNPLHPSHRVQWFGDCYDLGQLSDAAFRIVDADEVSERLRRRRIDHANTPLNEVTKGERNDSLFHCLRRYAYQAVRQFRGEHRVYADFFADVLDQAENMNSILMEPLGFREVSRVAASVTKWTMKIDPEAERKFRARQAARGRREGSLSQRQPWATLGISRRTFFNWMKMGIVDADGNMLAAPPTRGRAVSN